MAHGAGERSRYSLVTPQHFLIREIACVRRDHVSTAATHAQRLPSFDGDNPSQPCTVIVGELCARETLGLRPASTKRLEDGRRLPRDLDTALRQLVLGLQPHALRVEHRQEVVRAELVSLPGEIGGRARRASRQVQVTEAYRS